MSDKSRELAGQSLAGLKLWPKFSSHWTLATTVCHSGVVVVLHDRIGVLLKQVESVLFEKGLENFVDVDVGVDFCVGGDETDDSGTKGVDSRDELNSTWMLLHTHLPPSFSSSFFRETHTTYSAVHSHVTYNSKLHQYNTIFSPYVVDETLEKAGTLFQSLSHHFMTGDEFSLGSHFSLQILLDNPPNSCEGDV